MTPAPTPRVRCAECGGARGAHVWINEQQDAACPASSVAAMTFYRAAGSEGGT